MSSDTRKILLIGATGYDRAKEGINLVCVSWCNLSKIQNVRDYDILIINLLSIKTDAEKEEVDWNIFDELLDFRGAADILVNDGRIIILGDPRFDIPHSTVTKPFLSWTGLNFKWDGKPGDTVKSKESYRFANYVKHLRKWNYSLAEFSLNEAVFRQYRDLQNLRNHGMFPHVSCNTVCYNRYNHALAFSIQHTIQYQGRAYTSFGMIHFLPEIALDEDETLLIVLSDFCDAAVELPEPKWVLDLDVPGQKQIDDKIIKINHNINAQNIALKESITERSKTRACLKLLYEREFALEPIVRFILQELGANVEDPIEKNKEDGWITIQVGGNTYEGVLEIKSTKSNQFSEDGRKQLLDWIDRGRTLRGKNYKGIFIGNSAVTTPVEERPDAFSDSWKKSAALSQVCAMTSVELYQVYMSHRQAKINLEQFWAKLFQTNGVFDINTIHV